MKSTDNGERASTDVTGNSSVPASFSNFSPSPNGKAPSFGSHVTNFYRPGGILNQPPNEVKHQTNTLDPQAINVLNYNMAIKSLPLRPRPMAPTNIDQPTFAVQQAWQSPQFGVPNNSLQVPFNAAPLQCKPVNGFLNRNFFQKVNHDGMPTCQTSHVNVDVQEQTNGPLASSPRADPVLPSERMQVLSKKDALKKTLLEKSKENAKTLTRTTCLSPVSDCDVESSNSNSEFSTPKKSSSKGKKSSSLANTPLPETQVGRDATARRHECRCFLQMSQSGIFDKLSSLGPEGNRKYFLSQLFGFMNSNSTPIKIMPAVCRQTVDLYRLYHVVKDYGGLEKVCKSKQWRDVSSVMGFGGSTSAGFALKKTYCKYLFAYECKYDRDDVDPNPILASLDLLSKLETKKKPQEPGLPAEVALKEDSVSQDSFSELSNGLEEFTSAWEKPGDSPIFFNFVDALPPRGKATADGRCRGSHPHQNVRKDFDANVPPNLFVEYTRPTSFKRRKLMHHDCGNVHIQKVIRSLSSGLLSEMTWALDYLSIVTHDSTSPPLNLSKHPKLLHVLTDLVISCVKSLVKNTRTSDTPKLQNEIDLHFNEEEGNSSRHHFIFTSCQSSCHKHAKFSRKVRPYSSSTSVEESTTPLRADADERIATHQTLNIPDDYFDISRRIVDQAVHRESRQEISEPSEDVFNSSSDILNDLGKKCISISNILRNLASMSWNEKEMAASPKLLTFLCFFLHFHHEHHDSNKPEDHGWSVAELDVRRLDARVTDSLWWWNLVIDVRSNCVVILSYITSHLDLSTLHDDVCFKLCRGLLHWGVCQSTEALELHSGLNISVQRIALEALSKICISRSNVDFLVATPPFSVAVNFVVHAVKIIHRNDSDTVKDILLCILGRLVEIDSNLARALAIDGCAPFVLLGLIDEYLDPSVVDSTATFEGFVYEGNTTKTGSYTARKAAQILCHLSRVPENVRLLMRFKKHMLDIVTSCTDDDLLLGLISQTLAVIC